MVGYGMVWDGMGWCSMVWRRMVDILKPIGLELCNGVELYEIVQYGSLTWWLFQDYGYFRTGMPRGMVGYCIVLDGVVWYGVAWWAYQVF